MLRPSKHLQIEKERTNLRLENKIAFITGAASGIGAACAQRFVEEGATVIGFDVNEKPESDWIATVKLQPQCQLIIGDVKDDHALATAVQQTYQQYGQIDILVNSAGIAAVGPVHMMEVSEFERVIDINLKGTFLACRHILPIMMEQGSGSIVNISSIDGIEAQEITGAYNASKGGVIMLTKNMAIDYGRKGIRVNVICPGFIETPFISELNSLEDLQPVKDRIIDAHQMGRLGKPGEIANAALFLASDESSFVNGASIVVDGGFTAGKRFGIAAMFDLE